MNRIIKNYCTPLLLFIILSGFIVQHGIKRNYEFPERFSLPEEIKLTILYDNYMAAPDTKSDWGFSCLIEGTEKIILFDTGANGDILMSNIDKLGIDVKKINLVFLSHAHGDHTGGLKAILKRNPELPVYVASSFPKDFEKEFNIKKLFRLDKETEICKGVISTGDMGTNIHEQSLILNTSIGNVIITGCSHQGIINILKKTKEINDKNIYMVFGGFHLLRDSETVVAEIIKGFKEIGVQKCGATHCTGDSQINQFKKAFGENYVEMGTGRRFLINSTGLEII
jgi:7,8-dihydropterin-6-yl-methyl-4-(beta-D-ribofuranosyl)aminobenzene 5'-phosphate synthase